MLCHKSVLELFWATSSKTYSGNTFFRVLPSLLNSQELHDSVVALLLMLDAARIVEVINRVPVHKLELVLAVPRDKLVATLSGVQDDKFSVTLVPLLLEPEVFLAEVLVPVLKQCEHPELLTAFVNNLELPTLLLLLRGAHCQQLVALLDALEYQDVAPSSTVIVLLQEASMDSDFVSKKLLPLLQQADPQ